MRSSTVGEASRPSLLQRLANTAVTAYSAHLPDHPGKLRVVEKLVRTGRLHEVHYNTPKVMRRRGVLFKLNTGCWVQRTVYYYAEWDAWEIRLMLEHLPRNPVFFDVGAYFGYYSLIAAQQRGDRGRIFAFEPFSANYTLLCDNIALNGFGSVQAHRVALSDAAGTVSLELPPHHNRGSGHIAASGTSTAETEQVQTTTLDAFSEAGGIDRVDMMKIDVEGAESAVLRGAFNLLRACKPILLLELNPGALRAAGSSAAELLDQLWSAGYSTHRIDKHRLHRVASTGLDASDLVHGYVNLLCRPS